LGKCINALVPYSTGGKLDGEVEVCGRNTIEALTFELASQVGFIFSNPEDQLVTSTVQSELSFGLENLMYSKKEILKRVDWILEELKITDLAESSIFNLSTGQMQLIAIASFVIMEPEILILDDPLSHLNRNVGKQVIRIIADLYSKGTAIIWISQDVTEIFHLADRIVMLDKGKIIFNGPPEKFMISENVMNLSAIFPQHIELSYSLISKGVNQKLISPSLEDMIDKLSKYLSQRVTK